MNKVIRQITYFTIFIVFAFTSCKKEYKLFVGGFTEKDGEKGMSVFDFNSRNGKVKLISGSDVGPSPSYFCYSEKNRLFYILNEVMEFKGQFGGGLTTFKYDNKNSRFEKLNEMLIPYAGPCYISMSADSGYLFIANYPNGSVAVVRLNNGGIPETITDTILYVKEEPDRSNAHMILHDPAGRHVYVTDLGLDRIVVYDFDTEEGKLNQLENGIAALPKRSGPRHFVFNADGSRLYVINEPGSSLAVFNVDEKQGLTLLQTLPTIRQDFMENNYCADIHLGIDGKYLYGSNRGENTIVTFKVGDDGLLSLAGHTSCGGNWPRNFVIDPTGRFLIAGNQKSNYISVFRIDKKTGLPSTALDSARMKMPACLKFFNVD
ncbi:MAG: 6-phosphogluconolactonase [Bacteroidetes bacterium]|nr:6-phosphogluconolactonase [Bacteroidota bacterium]